MTTIPIVISAYNRPASLNRLLNSLLRANYSQDVNLIISIDGDTDNKEVINIAKSFKWNFGNKKIIKHAENLGLRNHIISCGDLSLNYDGIILLEEDLYVSPDFYNYALQSFNYYKDDGNIAGIALYSHKFNETAKLPFYAIEDGWDIFFLQLACSWGQCWSKHHWSKFRHWYNNSENLKINDHSLMPPDVNLWPETSWKKYFNKYIIETNKFFVYPRTSLTTNFGDKGQHHTGTKAFQVPLQYRKKIYNFNNLKDSLSIYDSFCEILPSCLNQFNPDLNHYDYCVDLYGMKPISEMNSSFIITSKKTEHSFLTYGKELLPLEANVIENIKGEELFLTFKNNCQEIDDYGHYRRALCSDKNQLMYYYSLTAENFYAEHNLEKKISNILNSYSYRLGSMLLLPLRKIYHGLKKIKSKID